MRDYRFRGKRDDTGEWAYGDLRQFNPYGNNQALGEGKRFWIIQDEQTSGGTNYEVEPDTVGQYTGLCDKNGKEIYEGDICNDARGFRFVVIWDDDARFLGRGIGKQKEYIRYVGQVPFVEVIGNIHDNPSLLEVQP